MQSRPGAEGRYSAWTIVQQRHLLLGHTRMACVCPRRKIPLPTARSPPWLYHLSRMAILYVPVGSSLRLSTDIRAPDWGRLLVHDTAESHPARAYWMGTVPKYCISQRVTLAGGKVFPRCCGKLWTMLVWDKDEPRGAIGQILVSGAMLGECQTGYRKNGHARRDYCSCRSWGRDLRGRPRPGLSTSPARPSC
jgi:hypothetical protein